MRTIIYLTRDRVSITTPKENFYMHRILSWILGYPVAAAPARRLIIDGNLDNLPAQTHAVALLVCQTPNDLSSNYICGTFCSGTLISPNVVVSAGHCLKGPRPSYDDGSIDLDTSDLFVLAGSTDYDMNDWSSKSRLVKVKQGVHAGYATNIRFPMDGDLALLELEDCIEAIQGQIAYARIATILTEPANDNCQSMTVSGFGQISNAPEPIRDADGRRRVITDIAHTHSVCRDAYVEAHHRLGSSPDEILQDTVIPEMFFCTGGSSLHSVCYGDSGGGYVAPLEEDIVQLVGVVSFGVGDFCTTSPDYSLRLSFHAQWILDQLESGFSTCPSWNGSWEKSFASWPLPEITQFSDVYLSSRCPTEWQCQDGRGCIDLSRVCDNQPDCEDGSDEDIDYCSASPAFSNRIDTVDAKNHLRKDLDDLVQKNSDWIETSAEKLSIGSQSTSPGVIIVGVLPGPSRSVRMLGKSADTPPSNNIGWPKSTYSGTPTDCDSALQTYTDALADAKAQDTRDDKWDASSLAEACIDLEVCNESTEVGQEFNDAEEVCSSLKSFLEWNVTVVDYAESFNERFDATCRDPKPNGFDPTMTRSSAYIPSFGLLSLLLVMLLIVA